MTAVSLTIHWSLATSVAVDFGGAVIGESNRIGSPGLMSVVWVRMQPEQASAAAHATA
jgi:hypothetical protein